MIKLMNAAAIAAVTLGLTAFAANAQSQGGPPNPPRPAQAATTETKVTPRDEFRQSLREFEGSVETMTKDINGLTEKLKGLSATSVESRKSEVDMLRQRLTQFGTLLEKDGPFSGSVDAFDSWLSAQVARVNSQRQLLGKEYVDQLIGRYQAYQKEVNQAREQLGTHSKSLNRLLEELTMAEWRAAEALQVEDAEAAATSLRQTIDKLGQEIGTMRARIKELGAAGA
jgi:chromosome segregation ATPase